MSFDPYAWLAATRALIGRSGSMALTIRDGDAHGSRLSGG
jgi:hypothetical protein